MDDEGRSIVREALDTQLRNEDFDRAVGRAVRRRKLDFKKYIEVIGELREMAQAQSINAEEAARRIFLKSE